MTRLKIIATAALLVSLMLATDALYAQSPDGAATPYVVQKGDSLSSISKQFYGKNTMGQKLWQANRNLVSHPNKLTPGDTIYIFPESTLNAQKTTMVPPPPMGEPAPSLYDRGKLLDVSFPKYFNFLADGRGLGGSGAVRITVKKTDHNTGDYVNTLYEVRDVGEIVANNELGAWSPGNTQEKAVSAGPTIMSTNDEVMVRFTEDVAKILDSETYGDYDPYFREYPIYGVGRAVHSTSLNSVDAHNTVGELYKYRGKLTIVARVEGLAPINNRSADFLKKGKTGDKNQDVEPVTYVARITYTEDAVEMGDRIFLFYPLEPGPERHIEPPFVEPAGTYNSLGN